MDDPWGSPWASSEPAPRHDPPTPSPPNNLLSPPPKAFFGSTSNLQSQSPWADSDGFGDWAGAEQTDTADWGVWAEPSSQNSQPSPRPDELAKGGSIAWPSSAATSPGLRPLPRSRASSVFRHHSPDPWATEISLHDEVHDTPTTPLPSNALGVSTVDSPHEPAETHLPSAQKQEDVESSEPEVDRAQSGQDAETTADNGLQTRESSSLPRDSEESHDPGTDDVTPRVEIHGARSRPSSTFSRDSSVVVERQDSPITSIDEDPKTRLQAVPRKISGKIQELVGLYDGLAKTVAEDAPTITRLEPSRSRSRGSSRSQSRNAEAVEDADFGDFEDAKSDYDEPSTDSNVSSTLSRRPSTPKAVSKESVVQGGTKEPADHQSTPPKISAVSVQQIIEKFGPIRFDVDLKSIDKLFLDLTQGSSNNAEEGEADEIPDRVIGDNFTTISERKTWYRISRFGSMRKHDSGDDDNYHRVEWSTSHLHSDTIKIVRRWMEEDSISGRVTLGAGKRTSVFNWDSAAAPVDLGKVFPRKSSATHSRTNSIPPKQSLEGSVHSTGSPTVKSIKSPIKPPDATPIADFGWSSNGMPTTHSIPSEKKRSGHAKSTSQSSPAITKSKPGPTAHVPVQPPPQPIQTEVTLEDEDEWGEMISSPKVETQPSSTLKTQPLNNSDYIASASVTSADTTKPNGKSIPISQSSSSVPKLSVSIPQSNQASKQGTNQTGTSAKAQRVEPWPLADFSIFENLSARTPKSSKQDPWPLADFSVFESPTSGSVSNWMGSLKSKPKSQSKPGENDQVRASTDTVAEARPPLKAVLGPIQKPGQERDQDEIVRNIVQNLPDLSYMLR
ncbi:spermidine resistance protein [Hypoxylon texense]